MYNTDAIIAATEFDPRSAPSLWTVCCYFLRLGAVGFGGPIALVSRMERDLVQARRWASEDNYREGLALAQIAPGPLAAQLAMYLGHLLYGLRGATVVGIAFIAPSFAMVVCIGFLYVRYGGLPFVQAMFYGVGAAVVGIIAIACARLSTRVIKNDRLLWAIFLVLAVTTAITGKENVFLFVGAGVLVLLLRGRLGRLVRGLNRVFFPSLFMIPVSAEVARIFIFFVKAALFVFGSGLAIVPFLHAGVVEEQHWLTEQQFVDAVAVAMITPGPVVITVGFIGYLVAGLPGAFASAGGVFLPVYLVVVLLAPAYRQFSANVAVKSFVAGVTAAATGALAGAVVVLGVRSIHDVATACIAAFTVIALLSWKIPEPVLIGASGLAGLVVRFLVHA